ncbi:MAG TPA: methyltransferase domain-containing protein [Mycobacteriales bacterium]|nr:methyltransferase domain-containing protein [Mycobacteriales bacterium]
MTRAKPGQLERDQPASPASNPRGLPNIGRTLVSARSFDEYVAMFALTEADLSRSILDCPGGAASFAAEASSRGASVVAVDPVYAAPPTWLAEHALDEAVRGNRHTGSSIESFVWTFFADITDHLSRRTQSARVFGEDLLTNPTTYVAASLPRLPFRDASFDLVLSSHLLFMYADRLNEYFHVAAACEMARVARREVRIFPLISDSGTDTRELLNAVRGAVAALGYTTLIAPSPYEFQKGGDEMLLIRRAP